MASEAVFVCFEYWINISRGIERLFPDADADAKEQRQSRPHKLLVYTICNNFGVENEIEADADEEARRRKGPVQGSAGRISRLICATKQT